MPLKNSKNYLPFLFASFFVFIFSFNIQAQETNVADAPTAADSSEPAAAATTPASVKEDPSSYIYDLKRLINKSKTNIKRVNEKIKDQAVYNRNQKREERARQYYEEAMKLLDEGKLSEARELFDKSIKITDHPEMKDYIKESERRFKVQEAAIGQKEEDARRDAAENDKLRMQEVTASYNAAVSLYKQKKFAEARSEFERVEELHPDFKATRSYLKIVEQDMVAVEAKQAIIQQKEIDRQQAEAEQARIREKELWRKEVDRKEQERKAEIARQANEVYTKAVKLYEQRQYKAAKEKFQEVEWVAPEFKATRKYLDRIDKDIADEEVRQAQQNDKEREESRWKQEVQRKKEEAERQKQFSQKDTAEQKRIEQEADAHYKAGVQFFDKEMYEEALSQFAEVEKFIPGYKSTKSMVERAQVLKAQQQEKREHDKRREEVRARWQQKLQEQAVEKEQEELLNKEAENIYQIAKKLYKQKQYSLAREKFLDVEGKKPGYKDSADFIQRIDKELKGKDVTKVRSEEIEGLYDQALALYKVEDLVGAKSKFNDVVAIDPEYKSAQHYLTQLQQQLKEKSSSDQKEQVQQKVSKFFKEGVFFYKQGDYEAAREKFNAVLSLDPTYGSARKYLEKMSEEKAPKTVRRSSVFSSEPAPEAIDPATVELVASIYNEAFKLYQDKDYEAAQAKFEEVEKNIADYKSTRFYLKRIDGQIAHQDELKAQKEQLAQSEEIKLLARQANSLYKQIIELANDRYTSTAKKKFARVDRILGDLQRQQQMLMDKVRRQEELARQEEMKEKQALLKEEQLAHEKAMAEKVEPTYQEAIALFENRNYEQAKLKFHEVKAIAVRYKQTANYLEKIERVSEDKKYREEKMRQVAREKMQQEGFTQDEIKIQEIVLKANAINDEVLVLLDARDFSGIKERFQQLEQLIFDLKVIKDQMAQKEKIKKAAQEQARQEKKEKKFKDRMLSQQRKLRISPATVLAPAAVPAPEAVVPLPEPQTEEELKAQQVRLYEEGMQLYKEENYSAAKERFSQLLTLSPDVKAQEMLGRIDRVKEREREQQAKDQILQQKLREKEKVRQQNKYDAMQRRERAKQLNILGQLEKERKRTEKLRMREMKIYDKMRTKGGYFSKQKKKSRKGYAQYVNGLGLRGSPSVAEAKVPVPEVAQQAPATENLEQLTPAEQKRQERQKQKEIIRQEKEKARQERLERRQKLLEEKKKKKESGESLEETSAPPVEAAEPIVQAVVENPDAPAVVDERQKQKEEKRKLKEQKRQERIQKKQELIAKKKQEAEDRRKLKQEEADAAKAEPPAVNLEELAKQKQQELEEAERVKAENLEKEKQRIQMIEDEKRKKKEEAERLVQEKIEQKKMLEEERLKKIEEQKKMREEESLRKKEEAELKRQEAIEKRQKLEEERKRKAEELAEKREQERIDKEQMRERLLEEAKAKAKLEQEERLEAQKRLAEEKERREQMILLEKEQRDRQAQLARDQQKVQDELEAGVEEIYQEALHQYEMGNYEKASQRFKDVCDILPNYKKTQSFVDKINSKLIQK